MKSLFVEEQFFSLPSSAHGYAILNKQIQLQQSMNVRRLYRHKFLGIFNDKVQYFLNFVPFDNQVTMNVVRYFLSI